MSGTLRFEILGPQRAWYGERELDLGPGKQRAVLAVLLLAAGRPVTTAQIVDAVWPDEPPANGPNVVQKYVAGLRRVIEPERSPRSPGQVLTLTDAGYQLRVGPEAVDAARFERGLRRAERLRAEGRAAEAVGELRSTVELWHGEPFTGFAGPYFDSARLRLLELRASALETWADLELWLGRHRELIGELVDLTAEFPVRERLRHQLMLALYRSGRQAEALAAYREFDELLRDEYGIEPGDALQDLHRRMLRSDPALVPPTAVSLPPAAVEATPPPAAVGTTPPPAAVEASRPPAAVAAPEPPAAAASLPTGPPPTAAPAPAPPAAVSPAPASPAAPASPLGPPAASLLPPDPAAAPLAPPAGAFLPSSPAVPAPLNPTAQPGGTSPPAVPSVSGPPAAVPPPAGPPPVSSPPGGAPLPGYGPPPVLPPPPAVPAATGKRQRTPSPGWASATATIAGTALVLLSFGCFTWLVMLTYAAWRRSWRLALVGVGYLVAVLVEVSMLNLEDPDAEVPGTEAVIFLGLAVVTWLVGAAHVVLLSRGVWAALTGGQGSARFRAEEERRIRREHARYLLYHYPAARDELRIGRPDLPRTFDDGGLIDVNAVPDQVLAGLPGLTADQCRQLTVDRWLRGPYASLEELAGRCLLPPTATDRLRELLFFLPPTPAAPAGERTPPAGS
ncbi:BTAD domain-containing putative transcriptional regulator [Micromonospora echinaurantiaca]|uniref:AfsR/SARP family transcriptional regulator n=1 Tax=Micromonospora echinaurantiaca TaxID=47857 RepID=UPI00379968ED